MLLALFLLSVALPAEPRTGALWPAAENGEHAAPSVTLGIGAALVLDRQWLGLGFVDRVAWGGGGRLSASMPLGDRVTVGLALTAGPYRPGVAFPGGHARWTVVSGEAGAIGVFGAFTSFVTVGSWGISIGDDGWEPRLVRIAGVGAAGVAAKGRLGDWTFEAALPLVLIFPGRAGDRFVVRTMGLGSRVGPMVHEARISYAVGESRSDVFVALQNVLPCVGWGQDQERWALETAFCSIGEVSVLGLQGTWRFVPEAGSAR